MRRHLGWLMSLMMVVALFGCGDAEEEDTFNNNFPTLNNGEDDADAGMDSGPDADADADPKPDGGADAGDGALDSDGGGEDAETGSSCAAPTELGTLDAGLDHNLALDFLAPSASLESSCDVAEASAGVQVYSFEVDQPARASLWASVPAWFDLREGDCDDPNEVLLCSDSLGLGADVSPDKTYHLLVWADAQGEFTLELGLQEAVCDPNDGNWCEEDQLNECRSTTSIRSHECLDECADELECGGNRCESAIAVDLSSESSATFSGTQSAYTGEWSADQRTECGFDDATTGSDTPNEEIFFEVSGLLAEQTLSVESLQSGDVAFFVLDSCESDACLAAVDDDEEGDQRLAFEVPADGDYFVVVEAWTSGDRDVELRFEVD